MPDYPKLAQLWWKNVAVAVTGEKTPQQAMDNLAEEMDQVMARLERAGMARCAPKLNPKGDPAKFLTDKGAPWKKLDNEKPKGQTIAYDTLLNAWKAGQGALSAVEKGPGESRAVPSGPRGFFLRPVLGGPRHFC